MIDFSVHLYVRSGGSLKKKDFADFSAQNNITHVEMKIDIGASTSYDGTLILALECFAKSPVPDGDLLVEAKSFEKTLRTFSTYDPKYGGGTTMASLSVMASTDYTLVIRQKEDIMNDGTTKPIVTLSFR